MTDRSRQTAVNMKEEMKEELTGRILPYWERLRDQEHGGFYGLVDFDLQVQKNAEKGCILNSRILWFFSEAAEMLQDDRISAYADHAYTFLQTACVDREYGGVYWSVTSDGQPGDTTKHTYNQAFAIYALAAYYRLSGKKEALDTAMGLFHRIETTCVDADGYLEAFSRDWKLMDNEKLSENGLLADKTMNTLLHVLEAYTQLYAVSGEQEVADRLTKILHAFTGQVFNDRKKQLEVFFDAKMHSISDLYSYGHDIEASWLLDRACDVLKNTALTGEVRIVTDQLTEAVMQHGLDPEANLQAMNNECFHGVVNTDRVWWVQAESVVGFFNRYQKTGNSRYLEKSAEIWAYIRQYFFDRRPGGEWFWDLNRQGQPVSRKPITEPWKCPYHNGRMCMEIMKRAAELR